MEEVRGELVIPRGSECGSRGGTLDRQPGRRVQK